MGKENIADTILSADNGFFSTMLAYRGYGITGTAPAVSRFPFQPVGTAFPRTEAAVIQKRHHTTTKLQKNTD
jgi:hypothetical protein